MNKPKFSESQIIAAIKEHEEGKAAADICRALGIPEVIFFNWKKKYIGMDSQELARLIKLEEESKRLEQMYMDLGVDNTITRKRLDNKFKEQS